MPKYVASRDAGIELDWQGSTRIGADLPAEIAALREKHQDVHVIGSVDFVQTLLAEQLYDELQLWVYPIVLGQGKKVFPDGAQPANMRLVHAETGDGGTLLLRYAPLPGEPTTGTMWRRRTRSRPCVPSTLTSSERRSGRGDATSLIQRDANVSESSCRNRVSPRAPAPARPPRRPRRSTP